MIIVLLPFFVIKGSNGSAIITCLALWINGTGSVYIKTTIACCQLMLKLKIILQKA